MSKKGYGNVRPRFAKYFARKQNSAGPHDEGKRRPDPERLEKKEMLELLAERVAERAIEDMRASLDALCEAGPALVPEAIEDLRASQRDFGVGDRVTCVASSPFNGCEGLVVKRDENMEGEPVWTVDYEGAGINCHLSNELERAES